MQDCIRAATSPYQTAWRATPLCWLYTYVLIQGVGFLRRFGLKMENRLKN